MTSHASRQVLLLSDRPTVLISLVEELGRLAPAPETWAWRPESGDWHRPGLGAAAAPSADAASIPLALVDLESRARTTDALEDLGLSDAVRRVAIAEGRHTEELIEALAQGYHDYLFYPVNPAELGLVWHRHLGSGEMARLSVEVDEQCFCIRGPSDVAYLDPAVTKMVATCRRIAELGDRSEFRLRIALGEAVANAMLHGNKEDDRRRVTIRAEAQPNALRVWVGDEGEGFDPATVPDPRAADRLERSSGRGLFLLRTLMDDVRFSEGGRVVLLQLDRDPGAPAESRVPADPQARGGRP